MKLNEVAQHEDTPIQKRGLAPVIRRASGIKGKTQHSGRGSWIMDANEQYDWDQLVQRLLRYTNRWEAAGILTGVEQSDDELVLNFDPERFGYYSKFVTKRLPSDMRPTLGTIRMVW